MAYLQPSQLLKNGHFYLLKKHFADFQELARLGCRSIICYLIVEGLRFRLELVPSHAT